MKDEDLKEFGFEELTEEEEVQVDDDFKDFGFEPLNEDEEVELAEEEEIREIAKNEENLFDKVLGTTAGTGLGLAAKKSIETLSDNEGLSKAAESMAYNAIGGDSTAAGKKFMKTELERLGDSAVQSRVNTGTVGRTALDEGLIGTKLGLTNSGDAYQKAEDLMLENIKGKQDLLKDIKTNVPLEKVQKDLNNMIMPNVDVALNDADEKAVDLLDKNDKKMLGSRSLSDLESQKSKMTDANMFQQDAEGKNLFNKYKRAAMNKNVEETLLEEGGEDLLEKFRKYKSKTGNAGIARNMLLQESLKKGSLPDVNISDIGVAGVASPQAALARRAFKDQGKGIIARQLDNVAKASKTVSDVVDDIPFGKMLKKGGAALAKNLPLIGGIVGAISTGNAAEAIPFLGDSEELGPARGTLERKVEMGESLSIEEQQELKNRSLDNYRKLQERQTKNFSEKHKNMTPEKYENFVSKVDKLNDPGMNKFSQELLKGLEDPNSQKQKMFALSQNPYFRKKAAMLMDEDDN